MMGDESKINIPIQQYVISSNVSTSVGPPGQVPLFVNNVNAPMLGKFVPSISAVTPGPVGNQQVAVIPAAAVSSQIPVINGSTSMYVIQFDLCNLASIFSRILHSVILFCLLGFIGNFCIKHAARHFQGHKV